MPEGGSAAAALALDDLVDEGLARLMRASGLDDNAPAREILVPFESLVEATRRIATPWTTLANQLDLTHLETLAGALALRCEWDARMADRVRRLQASNAGDGAPRPTLGLLAHLWAALAPRAQGAEARLLALLCAGNAVASGALVLGRIDALAAARTVAIHSSLVAPLLDQALGAANVATFGDLTARAIAPPTWTLPQSWRDALASIAKEIAADPAARMLIRCHDPSEARGLAALAAAQAGHDAVEVPIAPQWPPGLTPWLLARQALPVVVCDAAPGERLVIPTFVHGPMLAAAGIDGDIGSSAGSLREFRPALPSPAERAEILREILPGAPGAWLAKHWRAGVAALHDAASLTIRHAYARNAAPEIADVHAALEAHGQRIASGFGTLAQAVNTRIDDGALVASPLLRRDLDALRARCRHRETLTDALGVAARARIRSGVTALFVGASGTGKTFGAQWLAHMLRKPMLRVDAASVTSKYIGETEKNLARLLAHAEQVDCVLLFDEADALFGSRTDVKQSNDRFANAQTNYLLTRIESFGGIAILTSNSKGRFDDAFMRRLDAVIEFPLPDPYERAALWRAHLGKQRPADDAINLIAAEAELAGGHIRNAAITAALLAYERDEGAAITQADLIAAISDEYRKLGRHAPDCLAHPPAGAA